MKTYLSIFFTLFALAVSGNAMTSFNVNLMQPDSIFQQVDRVPYLKHHRNSLTRQIHKSLQYPSLMKLQGVEGVVQVECLITPDGKLENCRIFKGVADTLDEEAIRVVYGLGAWAPAMRNGRPVAYRMLIPVDFVLTDSERESAKALTPIDFENKPPLFVLDGKIVDGIVQIDSYNVRTIRVSKGDKAVERYGVKAKHGVVEITTKPGTPPVR